MLGRTYDGQNCSVAKSLELIGERWTMLVIREIFLGNRRFDQMAARLNLPPGSRASSTRACWRRSATRSAPSASSTA
jgi:hypothetical protein